MSMSMLPLPDVVRHAIQSLRVSWPAQMTQAVGCARTMYGPGWRNRVPSGGIVALTRFPLRQVAQTYVEIRRLCALNGWSLREVEAHALSAKGG